MRKRGGGRKKKLKNKICGKYKKKERKTLENQRKSSSQTGEEINKRTKDKINKIE